MKKILIIGATSVIAEAIAKLYAQRGDSLYLVARNEQRLEAIAQDLKIRGAHSVHSRVLDVNAFNQHKQLLDEADTAMTGMDVALIAHGVLPDQKACEQSPQLTLDVLNTNAMSTISLLTLLANRFEERQQGTIAVISSVAGDRGRQSNYVYGTSKSAISTFLQGLRNRLHNSNVHILTIKPGFVDTPMTASFKKNAIWAQPETVANGIVAAIDKKQDIVYVPSFWRIIMFFIKLVPERIFKRLRL